MAGDSWFDRLRGRGAGTPVIVVGGDPDAWAYNGPTSVTAAATVVADQGASGGRKIKRKKPKQQAAIDLAPEAWEMYRQVGELRYVSNAIASRMGQATLYVEQDGVRVDDSEDEDPILALITPQMVERMGLNLFIAGDCWLAGLPEEPGGDAEDPTDTTDVDWLVLSTLEVKESRGARLVEIRGEKYKRDDIYLVRVWDPHPAVWEEADSPVLSALPILRELVGLTQSISANVDSRLAGAGVYWLPNSILNSATVPEAVATQSFAENPVLNALMNAMLLPMEDRSNASSVVPLLMGAPDESIAKIRFDSFSTPFDKNVPAQIDQSLRRLGLALDAPPELLQGMGDANHWGMWLVRDEVIQAHVAPRLSLIVDALTTGFYRPIRAQQEPPGTDVSVFDVKADVSHLVQRPNRLADASQLHAVGVVSDKALREAGGFEDEDAPTNQEKAVAIALSVAQVNPQLLDNMPQIVSSVLALLDGTPQSGPGVVQSQRLPGTLTPLAPGNVPAVVPPTATAPAAKTAPNGTPTNGAAAPLTNAEGQPAQGSPV